MERRENIGTVHHDETIERVEPLDRTIAVRDRVRWGPIWAGLMTTLSVFLLLTLLMYGLGAQQLSLGGAGVNSTNIWVTAIVGLVSFFLGGWVATSTAAVRGAGPGLLNGFMVWALGIVLILALSSLGVGMAFGAAGSIFDQLITIQRGQVNVPNLNIPQVAGNSIQNGALWAFISLAVSAAAAMLGGWIGSLGRPIGYFRSDSVTTRREVHA